MELKPTAAPSRDFHYKATFTSSTSNSWFDVADIKRQRMVSGVKLDQQQQLQGNFKMNNFYETQSRAQTL